MSVGQGSPFGQWAELVSGSWRQYEGRVGEMILARNAEVAGIWRQAEADVAAAWKHFHDQVSAEWYAHLDRAGPAMDDGPPADGQQPEPLFAASEVRPYLPGQPGGSSQPGLAGPLPGGPAQTDQDPPAAAPVAAADVNPAGQPVP